MAFLDVRRISKFFVPQTAAVAEVSLEVEQGEIVCLLGPSGCGKTTLLRLIAGLEQPDAGNIILEGHDLAGVLPHQRRLGMMFQDFALFPHKNVWENVAFGLRMQQLPTREISERVEEMLTLVDLEGHEDRRIDQLSGGEQQRVALARSLAPGPRLLLLDEPLGALDRALRERLMADLRIILKRVGMTALYVTHDQTEAYAISDRMAVMNRGRIEQIGSPQVIYDRPETPFIAGFLGFENLLEGRTNEQGQIETAAGNFRPTEPIPAAGTEVLLMIKPNDVTIGLPANDVVQDVNHVHGTIAEITFRGRYYQLLLEVNEVQLVFEYSGGKRFSPGDEVSITVSPDQQIVYSAAVSPDS